MLIIGDRVHSNNYGYGTVVKIFTGDYPTATIKLDGLAPWFAEGHKVHCTLNGIRNIAFEEADPEVDFFVVYPQRKKVNIEQLKGYDPEVGPDMESLFKHMGCNSCKTEWDTCTYGLYCPECKSKDIHMALVWRQSF